jgi:hypothetical protein
MWLTRWNGGSNLCFAMANTHGRPTWDVAKMRDDMALKGWLANELARRAGVADMTAYRFLDGSVQTPPTAKKLAAALGHSVRRYLIPATSERRRVADRRAGDDRREIA